MQLPLQITFRHMEASAAMESTIRSKAQELDRFHEHIMSCRIVVEPQHLHKRQGNLYRVRIDVTTPGNEMVVSRESGMNQSHEDAYVAIRDAFDAILRQLEEHSRRQQGNVKSHGTPPHGRITQLEPDGDYGRITTSDGREVYFHRNSLLNGDFDRLEIGTEVRFDEECGELGPQASSVNLIGKHHIAG